MYCCQGLCSYFIHFNRPYIPAFPGLDFFPGKVRTSQSCVQKIPKAVLVVYTWLLFERVLMLDFASVEWYLLLVMAVW